jgi:hypothetical protein
VKKWKKMQNPLWNKTATLRARETSRVRIEVCGAQAPRAHRRITGGTLRVPCKFPSVRQAQIAQIFARRRFLRIPQTRITPRIAPTRSGWYKVRTAIRLTAQAGRSRSSESNCRDTNRVQIDSPTCHE